MKKPTESEKFRGKYRIGSTRLQGYDYGQNGAYFITICTKNREHFFGKIVDGKMQLSKMGEIVEKCWQQIPVHFPFVALGEWVVMPNHVHGVIVIDKNDDKTVRTQNTVETQDGVETQNTVETQDFASLQTEQKPNKFGSQSKNLASIIRGFKIGVTKYARTHTDIFNVWQPRFHDRIIRDEPEFLRVSEYIASNPQNWETDENFSEKYTLLPENPNLKKFRRKMLNV